MKKLLLASAVALFGLSDAQISQGTFYLSGQAGYSQTGNNTSYNSDKSIKILPTAGFFVAQNLAVGMGIGYTNHKTMSSYMIIDDSPFDYYSSNIKKSAFIVSPFVRKYWTLTDKLYFFAQLEVPLEFGKTDFYEAYNVTPSPITGNYYVGPVTSYTANYTSVGANVKPGLDYFLSKNWTVEAMIGEFGFDSYKMDAEGAKSINKTDLDINLSSVSLGIKYVFTK